MKKYQSRGARVVGGACVVTGSLAVALAYAGCGNEANTTGQTSSATVGDGSVSDGGTLDGSAGDGGTQQARLSEAQVVGVVASGNAGEVDDGMFAIARAANEPDVQAFGRRMVVEHSQNQQQLESLGLNPKESSASKKLRSDAEKADSRLSKASASDFPRVYLDAAVEDHTNDLKRIDNQLLPSAKSPELKSFLNTLRATIASHLKLAQQLQARIGSDGGTGDAGAADASTDDGSVGDAGASDAGAGDAGTDGGTGSSLSDAQIAQAYATANAGEGEQGTIALAHTSNTAVSSFARMLITDHTAAEQSLAGVLKSQNLTTANSSVSKRLRSSASKIVEKLVKYNDDKFDTKFAATEVAVHEKVLKLLDDQLIPGADNAQLRANLTAGRATVARHLQMAQQLVKSLGSAGADGGVTNDGGAYEDGGTSGNTGTGTGGTGTGGTGGTGGSSGAGTGGTGTGTTGTGTTGTARRRGGRS